VATAAASRPARRRRQALENPRVLATALIAPARPQADSAWGGLPAATGPIAAASDAEPRRRFFASSLPEQLVRDQVEIEVAKGGGFIAAAAPLEELRAGLAAAGVAATLYPIDA